MSSAFLIRPFCRFAQTDGKECAVALEKWQPMVKGQATGKANSPSTSPNVCSTAQKRCSMVEAPEMTVINFISDGGHGAGHIVQSGCVHKLVGSFLVARTHDALASDGVLCGRLRIACVRQRHKLVEEKA
eukprot:CAMPEP_0195650024 /NCGR_PEP_ID=MMETSP0815-20121206/31500_1 /TAXON_ID=97485 /ORGANISM="Prymnesium parvum, Strain Texoma1" /LENGTH=129 /DNA_ID=CAMNT_0040793809 /DNA_START=125 /DNA_END=514 /DNA_ORIENTATION=+